MSCVPVYKHATRRLLVIWGRNAPVGDLFLVFLLVCCRGREAGVDSVRIGSDLALAPGGSVNVLSMSLLPRQQSNPGRTWKPLPTRPNRTGIRRWVKCMEGGGVLDDQAAPHTPSISIQPFHIPTQGPIRILDSRETGKQQRKMTTWCGWMSCF